MCVPPVKRKKEKAIYRESLWGLDKKQPKMGGSRASKQGVRTPTGGLAPHKELARRAAMRSAPTSGGLKKEKCVRTDITRKGGDGNTRAGEEKRKAAVAAFVGDAVGLDNVAIGRKRTIESIMSGDVEAKDGASKQGVRTPACGKAVAECRKRKAGRKWITGTTSSSSSSEEDDEDEEEDEDAECGSGEEADIRDGTDVLEDESKGKVIPSSLRDSEEESGDEVDFKQNFERWKRDCDCGCASQGDCACDAGC